MDSRYFMVILIADIIVLDDKYTGNKLNDSDVWDNFIEDIFYRMNTIGNNEVRNTLKNIDKETFQNWIDEAEFWIDVDNEIIRRGQILKTMIPSKHEGYC